MNRREFLRNSAILAAVTLTVAPGLVQSKSVLAKSSVEMNPELWLLATGKTMLDADLFSQISQELTPNYHLFFPMVKN